MSLTWSGAAAELHWVSANVADGGPYLDQIFTAICEEILSRADNCTVYVYEASNTKTASNTDQSYLSGLFCAFLQFSLWVINWKLKVRSVHVYTLTCILSPPAVIILNLPRP